MNFSKISYFVIIFRFKAYRCSTSLPGGNQVSPLSLPAQSDLTTIKSTPPLWPSPRKAFAFAFALWPSPAPSPSQGLPRRDLKAFLPQLRSQKAPILEPFWVPNRPNIGPRRVLKRYFFENVVFHANLRFPIENGQNRAQDEPKIDPRSPQDRLKSVLAGDRFSGRFSDRFLFVLGSVLASSWAVLRRQGAVLDPSWGRLGRPR